jgi:NO-binding membrane sensor protein with MHYT domain
MLALEMMKQRTSKSGLRNHLLLLGASTSLGAVGIWSMHMIGMSAMMLHTQLGVVVPMGYDTRLTFGSALLAILVIAISFTIAGDPRAPNPVRALLAGLISGVGVLLMHYMGMLSIIVQARAVYDGWVIFASVVVGLVAATVAMFVFFRFGHLWRNDMRIQTATSCTLAVAICAMH